MKPKSLLDTLEFLRELGLSPELPQELRTRAQDAHDSLGFVMGMWDTQGRPMKFRQIITDSVRAGYEEPNGKCL